MGQAAIELAGGAALGSLAWLAVLAVAASHSHAQPQPARRAPTPASARPAIRVEVPELTAGMRASVDVFVRPPGGPEQPLLLTPRAEGEAVRVVRGRLLRADARTGSTGELHFQVPIEARSAGTAVLRFALLAYRCDESRCTAVHASQVVTVQVRAQ